MFVPNEYYYINNKWTFFAMSNNAQNSMVSLFELLKLSTETSISI
jgi:hypothetical protein